MKLDRTQAPKFSPIQNFKLKKAESHRLDNGIPFHLIPAGNQPLVNLQLIFKAGKRYEAKEGVSYFTAKMLTEGTTAYSSSQMYEAFDKLGAFFEIQAGFEHLVIEVICLSKHVENVLDLVLEFIAEAQFPESELQKVIGISHQQLKVNLQKNNYLAGILFRETLFGKHHPYGYRQSHEMIDGIKRDDLVQHYQQNILSKEFDVIVAGMVDQSTFQLINQKLGRLPIHPRESKAVSAFSFKPVTGSFYEEKEEALQTSLRIGRLLFPIVHPDRLAFEVFNEILGGYFGSRLMKNIREEKGYTYGIYSSVVSLFQTGYFLIGTDVIKDKRQEVLDEIYKEIKELKDNLVSDEELSLVKNYMAGSFVKSINTPLSVIDYFKTIYFNHLPEDYYDHYVSQIQQVTAEQVHTMANKYFNEDLLEVLVG
ncbi:pitrilysin family protein [Rapidithrix thailandica]|uniref:Pitrilysin family protein n=1 Tax=Rapidithrix thailandica TaxID=413964 RepID=A0AAW9S822_9BACT